MPDEMVVADIEDEVLGDLVLVQIRLARRPI
jgi:hypothetical protein